MEGCKWKDPGRKRRIDVSYTDPGFVKFYDIDNDDFEYIVGKVKVKQPLTNEEDRRYGDYMMTLMEIVVESPKFKGKTRDEKYEMRDQAYYELCTGLPCFNPGRGSRLFSYAYRICYVAYVHYFTMKKHELEKQDAITKHCLEELDDYRETITDHKVRTINHE